MVTLPWLEKQRTPSQVQNTILWGGYLTKHIANYTLPIRLNAKWVRPQSTALRQRGTFERVLRVCVWGRTLFCLKALLTIVGMVDLYY